MYGCSSHSLNRYQPIVYSIPTLVPFPPICRKTVYHPFHWFPENNFGVYRVYQGLFSKSMLVDQFRKIEWKFMIVISKIKHKCKTILGVMRNLVLDFILYFVTAYMRKYPIHVTSRQRATQNTLYITWRSK